MSATTNAEKLARMANQIASFFRSYPEAEAAAGVHKHLVAFWTPRMRERLQAHALEAGNTLDALVLRAIREEPRAESPVRAATRDPQRLGLGASDAG
ncbi:formate dehydrogenase subunit delta [Methylobacterium sp. A54F]